MRSSNNAMRSFDGGPQTTWAKRLKLLAGGCALALVANSAIAQDMSDDDMLQLATDHYNCAIAMAYAQAFGNTLEVSDAEAFAGLEAVLKTGRVNEELMTFDVEDELFHEHGYVSQAEPDDQPESFMIYAWRKADQCVEIYKAIRVANAPSNSGAPTPSAAQSTASEGRPIDVAFLRDHYRQNRNARLIADYIVERYPSGKRLMGDPIAELEFLAELINALPDQGMRSLSDPALLAMVNKQYWQYDPPASRKVMAEYRRRLSVRRYNDREAQNWARKVDEERRQELATAAIRMSERWGTSIKCTNSQPSGVGGDSYTSCRTLDRFGQ